MPTVSICRRHFERRNLMHVLRIDSCPPPVKRLGFLLLALLLPTAMLIYFELRDLTDGQRSEVRIGFLVFIATVACSVLPIVWKAYRYRGTQTLVVVGTNTIAVRPPRSRAVYIPWRECVDYYPCGMTFVTNDGKTYSLRNPELPQEAQRDVITFMFERCWPHVESDTFLGIITQEQVDRFHDIVESKTFARQRLIQWGPWGLLLIGVILLILLESMLAMGLCITIAIILTLLGARARRQAWKDFLKRAQAQRVSLIDVLQS